MIHIHVCNLQPHCIFYQLPFCHLWYIRTSNRTVTSLQFLIYNINFSPLFDQQSNFFLTYLEGGKKLIICTFFAIIMSILWSSNLPSPVYFSLLFYWHHNLTFTIRTHRKNFNLNRNFLVCIMFIMWLILRVLLGRWLPFCKSTRVKTRHYVEQGK